MRLTAIPVGGEIWPLIPAPMKWPWMDQVPDGHLYRCQPLVQATGMGWVILNPSRFTVVWNGQYGRVPDLLFDWGPWNDSSRRASAAIASHFGSGIMTFQVPFLFRTDREGVGLRVSGAPNFYKFNCHALEGWVETWWLPFTFTMNWKIDAPYVPVVFEEGDPLVFIQPTDIATLESCEPMFEDMAGQPKSFQEQYREWKRSRAAFNADVNRGAETGWQKHYSRGTDHSGNPAGAHRKPRPQPCFGAAGAVGEAGRPPLPVPDPGGPDRDGG